MERSSVKTSSRATTNWLFVLRISFYLLLLLFTFNLPTNPSIIALLPTVAEMDDTARAIEFLKSFVAGSEKYFWRTIKNSTTGRKEDICHYTADGYGKFLGKGAVAFLPHALKMILEEKGGFKSADKLVAEFYDKGYLRTRNGRYKVQTWINGKPVWTYNFEENLLRATEDDTAEEEEVSFNG